MIFGPHLWVGWALGWAGLVSTLLFWAVLIVAIVALIRYLTRGGGRQWGRHHGVPGAGPFSGPVPPPGMVTPEHILAERFARGEIDEQEFRQRMAVLRGAHPQPGTPGPPPGTSPPPAGGPPPAPGASSSLQGPPPAP